MVDIGLLVDGKEGERLGIGNSIKLLQAVDLYCRDLRDLRFIGVKRGNSLEGRSVAREVTHRVEGIFGFRKELSLRCFLVRYSQRAGKSHPEVRMIFRSAFFLHEILKKHLPHGELRRI